MSNALGRQPAIALFVGAIADLRRVLEEEAKQRGGRWARRRLPSGTVVSLRYFVTQRARLELAIARDAAPTGVTKQARWEAEVREIQLLIGAQTFTRYNDVYSGEAVAAVFAGKL